MITVAVELSEKRIFLNKKLFGIPFLRPGKYVMLLESKYYGWEVLNYVRVDDDVYEDVVLCNNCKSYT